MDRLQLLEKELEGLRVIVAGLQQEVMALRGERDFLKHPIEELLAQRGLPMLSHGDRSHVLSAPNSSPAQEKRLYELMRRYSFRLFVRDLIRFPEGDDLRVLSRYCSVKTVRSYLRSLSELAVAESPAGRGYRFIPRQITSFGPTLEWYVSEIFQREFLAPARFSVRLQNTRYGGDYDVIALLAGQLVYVEVKSSPPRGVELQAVSAFLNRLRDLQPHVAVFLVDTELRMRDKIVPLFVEAFERSDVNPGEWPVDRLVNEIFHIRHRIYLINSRKGIYTNLRRCFRDLLHSGGKASFPVGTPSVLP